MKKILILTAVGLVLSSCSSKIKKTLGLTENMPDEYQVQRYKSLEVPPCYQDVECKSNKKTDKKLSKAEKALLGEVK